MRERGFVWSPLYSQPSGQCSAHSRRLINIHETRIERRERVAQVRRRRRRKREKRRTEAEGGKKEGPAFSSAPTGQPSQSPEDYNSQQGPGSLGPAEEAQAGAGPAPDSPAPVVPHVTAAAAAPAGTCSLGRGWEWGWAHGDGRGPGGGGRRPLPVTSCGAAGAGAYLQRLRRRRPRLARLPASLRPPSPAAPASFAATPPLPARRPFLTPSSFPSSPPPRTAGRGTSPGQQPGETAGPGGAPRGRWAALGLRPRRALALSALFPRLPPGSLPAQAPGGEALPPPGPRGAPARPGPPGRPRPPSHAGRPRKQVPRRLASLLFYSAGVAEVILEAGAGRVRGVPLLPVPGGPGHQITSAGCGAWCERGPGVRRRGWGRSALSPSLRQNHGSLLCFGWLKGDECRPCPPKAGRVQWNGAWEALIKLPDPQRVACIVD